MNLHDDRVRAQGRASLGRLMDVLSLAIILFLILESLNIATLYVAPGATRGNGLGVFRAWERSKADPEMHDFVRYLAYWVAGTKLIFVALLVVILLTASDDTRLLTVVALIASISSFYWRLFPSCEGSMPRGRSSRAATAARWA
jgi:hypothetical protein